MSYSAIVCQIAVRDHPNADRLKLANCFGNQVVVGADSKDGDIGLFFPSDGRLSIEFATANDLIRRKNPVTGANEGGFFEENRRVRAQPFRGEKSYGFYCPLSYLDFTGGDTTTLKVGDTLTEFNGVQICGKYYTPATLRAISRGVVHRNETLMFRMHDETEQFKYFADKIESGSLVTITEKCHGTSHRYGRVLDNQPVKLVAFTKIFNRIAKKLRLPFKLSETKSKLEWTYLSGSRRVILSKPEGRTPYYGTDNFRNNACASLEGLLHKGEVLYFEIVGYTDTGAHIMQPHSIERIQDKDARKNLINKYGNLMEYTYGNPKGACSILVYRIVMVNEDGIAVDLPWLQVKRRCRELGLQHVPEFMPTTAINGDFTVDHLKSLADVLCEGKSTLGNHIREGVVIRVDDQAGVRFLKLKSWLFGVLEGYLKENAESVDLEEAS